MGKGADQFLVPGNDKVDFGFVFDETVIQAPTAMHEEPWAFVIIQDRSLLLELSDWSGQLINATEDTPVTVKHAGGGRPGQEFNIFYNASTLIVIYGYPKSSFVAADCWLAAENMMLAAVGLGLATCPIGFAVAALNSQEWKNRFGVPAELTAYAPIIVGVASHFPEVVTRTLTARQDEVAKRAAWAAVKRLYLQYGTTWVRRKSG